MDNKKKAYLVAERAHLNQTYGIFPYMYHIHRVVKVAERLGYDDEIIVGCILHDVLEDTPLSYNDILEIFGFEIAEIVFCVTDELGRNRKERKSKTYVKIKGNWKATVVKICDRIGNIEHSIDFDEKMYQMYLKEMDGFYNGLKEPSHPEEVSKAWTELEKISKI